MGSIRREERKLYAEVQLLKMLSNNEKAKKEKTLEIEKKRMQVLKKQRFFHNFLIANDKVNKGGM